jgi:hypothetical protein
MTDYAAPKLTEMFVATEIQAHQPGSPVTHLPASIRAPMPQLDRG